MGEPPFNVEHYANYGTGEPWVTRITLGLPELVYGVPAFGKTRDAFSHSLGSVFDSLGIAFQSLRELRERTEKGAAPVLELADSYASLYGHLWAAHKDRFQSAMKALGLDIGFLFQSDANFEKHGQELVTGRPELADLVTAMRRDRDAFQNALRAYRNDYLEHRKEPTDPKMLAVFHRLSSAERMFENVWQAMEDYVVLYVIANLPPMLRVAEIPEEKRDPSRPIRFTLMLVGESDTP